MSNVRLSAYKIADRLIIFSFIHMNRAALAFRCQLDISLACIGIESHQRLRHYSLYGTVIAVEEGDSL